MIEKDDYEEILSRIKHIKSLFAFGEGILPFLEELFVFLREVTPLLNDVSDSIMNTTGRMPDAAIELDAAVEETSDATHRIMESVETILKELDKLEELEAGDSDEALESIDDIRTRADSIMNALQFHDIVSQKLVHVRRVLSEIQQKMLQLFTRVYDLDIDKEVRENILSTMGVNVDEFERILQSKIEMDDRLTGDKPMKAKGDEEEEEDASQKFDQSDIDDLFG
jgi:chemotaxis regulatin CheY-phosphate phosphatase CheZ